MRPTKAFFGWIPSNHWIFHHSSSFLMTLDPSSSAFVSFLSYRWLFKVATSFVNGPLQRSLVLCSPQCGQWVDSRSMSVEQWPGPGSGSAGPLSGHWLSGTPQPAHFLMHTKYFYCCVQKYLNIYNCEQKYLYCMDAALCTENIYICLFQKYLGIVKLFKTLRVF